MCFDHTKTSLRVILKLKPNSLCHNLFYLCTYLFKLLKIMPLDLLFKYYILNLLLKTHSPEKLEEFSKSHKNFQNVYNTRSTELQPTIEVKGPCVVVSNYTTGTYLEWRGWFLCLSPWQGGCGRWSRISVNILPCFLGGEDNFSQRWYSRAYKRWKTDLWIVELGTALQIENIIASNQLVPRSKAEHFVEASQTRFDMSLRFPLWYHICTKILLSFSMS